MSKIQEFASESSIHGVKFVLAVDQIKSARIFFLFSFVFSLCGFSYYVYSAYYKFMYIPETVTRSYDVNSINFPAPAVTICSNLFAREDYSNFFKTYQKYINKEPSNYSEQECKYFVGNLHWCQPAFGPMAQKVCGRYDLKNLNVVEAINKSALLVDEMLYNCITENCDNIIRIFTSYGVCYSFNMQGFHAIFNTETIHDDFRCFIRKDFDNATDIPWTPEKGYETKKSEFPQRAIRGQLISHQTVLTNVEKENICALNTYRIFVHKPNEIITSVHESTFLNYDEVNLNQN